MRTDLLKLSVLCFSFVSLLSLAEHLDPGTRSKLQQDATIEKYKNVDYDYVYDWKRPDPTGFHIRIKTDNTAVSNEKDLWVEVAYRDIAHSSKLLKALVPMEFKDKFGVLRIPDCKSDTVYEVEKMRFFKGNPSGKSEVERKEMHLATRDSHYFTVVASDPNAKGHRESEARRNIVMSAFKELHDWREGGLSRPQKPWYTSIGGTNWCGDFYRCAAHLDIKVSFHERWNELDAFASQGALTGVNQVPGLSKTNLVHGDLLKLGGQGAGGHRGMLIGFDADSNNYIFIDAGTMGGTNFDVVQLQRTPYPQFDTLGRITAKMLR